MMRARRSGVVAAHFGNASRAACTAASTSAALANATRPDRSPTDGLKMSPKRPLVPPDTSPSIQCPTSFMPPLPDAIAIGMILRLEYSSHRIPSSL